MPAIVGELPRGDGMAGRRDERERRRTAGAEARLQIAVAQPQGRFGKREAAQLSERKSDDRVIRPALLDEVLDDGRLAPLKRFQPKDRPQLVEIPVGGSAEGLC